ncbi:hypothetical protein EYC98_00400 [Halieaceae bacterium IMCC14734]|uniref:Uncharacterized protein n=1 Tax=Candidatus Litorirhabdus singularis TaxID=2518993 RepID=A0ABT3TD01_9GAMM|nr:hypothetical protein [Candidatus Litorirhabdus singularis]MCX2979319.1 hypothetical protein [Candidatus Litorirhabdus singularis]
MSEKDLQDQLSEYSPQALRESANARRLPPFQDPRLFAGRPVTFDTPLILLILGSDVFIYYTFLHLGLSVSLGLATGLFFCARQSHSRPCSTAARPSYMIPSKVVYKKSLPLVQSDKNQVNKDELKRELTD